MSKLEKTVIDFSKKELIEKIRLENKRITGSHCFNNIIIWQKKWGLELYASQRTFAIKSSFWGENTWFFPCGDDEEKRDFIQELLDKEKISIKFKYMTQSDAEWLEKNFPGVFDIIRDDDSSEYILLRQEQVELAGPKFHRLKTQVNYVNRNYNIDIKRLDCENKDILKEIVAMWSEHKNNVEWKDDSEEAQFFIDYFKELDGEGLVFYKDNEPVALMGGFPLSEDIYDSFLSKTKYMIKGMGAYIKYKFFEYIDEKYKYINIEEDLGLEGLRVMKEGLRPISKIDMYEARH